MGKNGQKKHNPIEVKAHDFPNPKVPKAAPYGVYDVSKNEGWVSVGISHDTAQFAVATIKRWWQKIGKKDTHMQKEFILLLIVAVAIAEDQDYGK